MTTTQDDQTMQTNPTNKGASMKHQQGDVCLEPCKIPASAKKIKGLIVRHGESGHRHEIVCDKGVAELREEKGTTYARVLNGTVTLTHEEHAPQVIEKGDYIILPGVFEYDYEAEEAKRVID